MQPTNQLRLVSPGWATSGLLCALTCVLLSACFSSSGTGGESIRFEFGADASPDLNVPFETSAGWTVELEVAQIALGPAWIYENPAAAASSPGTDWLAELSQLAIPTAHAHPGDAFFNGGQLRGEFLEQHVFDLRETEPIALGEGRGVAGPCGTLSLVLDPPSSAIDGDPSMLDGYPIWVAGRATRIVNGGAIEQVAFAGGLELEPDERELTAINADFDLREGDELMLRIDARSWFDEAQFDRLEIELAPGVMQIEPGSQVALAWKLAARNANNYSLGHVISP